LAIISVIGPKGGIGKTTLSINTSAALTHAVAKRANKRQVCLVDLDLRLPTLSDILNSHPSKTFFDLFGTLANKTFQVDYLHALYRIISSFRDCLDGSLPVESSQFSRSFALYQNLNPDLFNFSDFEFSDEIHELFFNRGNVRTGQDLEKLAPLLSRFDMQKFHRLLADLQGDSRPIPEEYVHYVEEYGFSIIGGEVPILGKKSHRKRINEPALLVFFLEFLDEIFDRFEYVVLDTPAGGVGHLASLMNRIENLILVFDMSNRIAINGSIDALHSFIDYYEDFFENYKNGRLTGADKVYVNRLTSAKGKKAVEEVICKKSIGLVFNRCQDDKETGPCLDRIREYLDTLNQYEKYKNRIHIMGMLPQNRIISITNNKGALFYGKDRTLSAHLDQLAEGLLSNNASCPTLAEPNSEIVQFLQSATKAGFAEKLSRIATVPWGNR
jgi:cellulose biosynthesis protein BcsQ